MAAVQTQASTDCRLRSYRHAELGSGPESPRSVAPAPGTGEAARRQRVTWKRRWSPISTAQALSRQPQQKKTAEIVVSFALDRTGHVISTGIVKGSGDAAFDEAALAMVKRSDPVPQPPPLVADEGLNFTLPVIFRVKGRS